MNQKLHKGNWVLALYDRTSYAYKDPNLDDYERITILEGSEYQVLDYDSSDDTLRIVIPGFYSSFWINALYFEKIDEFVLAVREANGLSR